MAQRRIHKFERQHGLLSSMAYAACAPYFSTPKEYTTLFWAKVTCRKCLRLRNITASKSIHKSVRRSKIDRKRRYKCCDPFGYSVPQERTSYWWAKVTCKKCLKYKKR